MFHGVNMEDIPDDLKKRMESVELSMRSVMDQGMEVMNEIESFFRSKVERDDGITEDELENAIQPVSNLSQGYRPAVVPFEIRGGESDGKRLITLCVMLADGKTVMPVLQVPDFAVIEQAEYVGSMDDLQVILPDDPEGRGWQETVSETVKEYQILHGGQDG